MLMHRRLPLVLMLVTAACGAGCERRAEAPRVAAKMRIGIGLPPKGTPGTGPEAIIRLLANDSWLTNKPDGHQAERIATGWEWDQARTTLRLKLRRDVYFHDGTLLTPELAAQALREAARTDGNRLTSIASVTPVGEDAVDITLKERNSFILPDLTGVFVLKPGDPAMGTGPFQIVRADPKTGVTLLGAFPQYFRGRPDLAEVEVASYPTQRNAWVAMMRGDIDMLHEVSREAVEFVKAESTVKSYQFPRPYYIPLVFSVRHPILKNPEVRKAINEAFDRAALVRDAMNGQGRPAEGPVWPLHFAYSASTQRFAFDPASARRRLDNAGLRVHTTGSGASTRFSFTCLVFAGDARFERLAVLAQKQLADVGIDMKLQPLPLQALATRLKSGDFEAFLFEFAGRSLSWVYEMWRSHDGSRNNSGYKSADAALDRIRGARSDDEVRQGVSELSAVLHEDPPAAFLVWQTTARAVSLKFDVRAEEDRDIFANPWQWRPAGALTQAAR